MAEKLPEPEIVIDPMIPEGEVHLCMKPNGETLVKIINVGSLKSSAGSSAGLANDVPPLEDQRTEEQDIALRQKALALMRVPLPSQGEVDRNYFRPTAIGDPGEYLQGKELAEHEPRSELNKHLGKMMPIGWVPPPVQPPQPGDVEFLEFWDAYFKETGDVPTWTELETYDAVRRRAYGSPKRGEKPKRRGFQVTGRWCKKHGCGGEIRYDPDVGVEQCFGCGEMVVLVEHQGLVRQ